MTFKDLQYSPVQTQLIPYSVFATVSVLILQLLIIILLQPVEVLQMSRKTLSSSEFMLWISCFFIKFENTSHTKNYHCQYIIQAGF